MTKDEFMEYFFITRGYNLTDDQFYGKVEIKNDLNLSDLTSIPEGFNPVVGSLDLQSLISIPNGFNPVVYGSLFLMSLISIPKGFNPVVGGNLYLDSLTSIPKGFNPVVGRDLYLNDLIEIPENWNPTNIKGCIVVNIHNGDGYFNDINSTLKFINFEI